MARRPPRIDKTGRIWRRPAPKIAHVTERNDDVCWDAFVAEMLTAGAVYESRSRYGDKPALFMDGREIAHLEEPGVIDVRITRAGWSRAKERYGNDPAVRRDSARRDWIELSLNSPADLDRLGALLAVTVAANAR